MTSYHTQCISLNPAQRRRTTLKASVQTLPAGPAPKEIRHQAGLRSGQLLAAIPIGGQSPHFADVSCLYRGLKDEYGASLTKIGRISIAWAFSPHCPHYPRVHLSAYQIPPQPGEPRFALPKGTPLGLSDTTNWLLIFLFTVMLDDVTRRHRPGEPPEACPTTSLYYPSATDYTLQLGDVWFWEPGHGVPCVSTEIYTRG
jgi:hypothetical protein